MAQNGPITMTNSEELEVVLTPEYKEGLLSAYSDRSAVASLRTDLTLGMRKPVTGQNDKVSIKLEIPYVSDTSEIAGVESVTAFVDFVIPETAPAEVRENLKVALSSVLNDTIVSDLINEGGFPY